jgi:hypothetical protein
VLETLIDEVHVVIGRAGTAGEEGEEEEHDHSKALVVC